MRVNQTLTASLLILAASPGGDRTLKRQQLDLGKAPEIYPRSGGTHEHSSRLQTEDDRCSDNLDQCLP